MFRQDLSLTGLMENSIKNEGQQAARTLKTDKQNLTIHVSGLPGRPGG